MNLDTLFLIDQKDDLGLEFSKLIFNDELYKGDDNGGREGFNR